MYIQLWQSRLRYYRKYYPPAYVSCVLAAIRIGLWNERRRLMHAVAMSDSEREQRLRAISAVRALCVL